MDDSNYLGNRHDERLGVNKIGKNIRKSPPQPPDFTNPARQQPYPQVYNINKNDFRDTVQRLTGSPSHHQEPPPIPHRSSPNPDPSIRLQKIRPPRLAPINVYRPQMPVFPPRPTAQYGQPPPPQDMVPPPMTSGDHMGWANAAESPISAYMRYLQHSVMDPGQRPPPPLFPSPRGPPPPPPPLLPSPRTNQPLIPPSPTSQFLLPSPSGYLNLLSPLSPHPLLSPGYRYPPPLTPDFSFSPVAQSGILSYRPPPPPSPGMGFPSPGFFQFSSPKWRD